MKLFFLASVFLVSFILIAPEYLASNAMDSNLYLSQDKAQTWRKVNIQSDFSQSISLSVSAIETSLSNQNMYMGTRDRGLYVKKGTGYWQHDDQISTGNVYDIAIRNEKIYLASYRDKYGRIIRSLDNGNNWEEVYIVSQPKYAVFSVLVDPLKDNIVYAGTAQGALLKSTDYGKSWQIIRWFDGVISDIAMNTRNSSEIYISTFEKGIFKSNDGGANWLSLNLDGAEKLIVDSQRPHILYAATKNTILESRNSGKDWQEMRIITPSESVLTISLNRNNTDQLYYGAGHFLYFSFDRGISWQISEMPDLVKSIHISPYDENEIYVGMGK